MTKIITKKEKGGNRHWKNFQDKEYLGAHNLEEGEELELTITKFEGEELVQKTDGAKEAKMVLYFKEDKPKMILNITNAKTLEMLYGSHPDQWTGKKIRISAPKVKAFGSMMNALRIRDFVPGNNVDVVACAEQMNACKNKAELKVVWDAFSTSAKNSPELIALKETLKNKLA